MRRYDLHGRKRVPGVTDDWKVSSYPVHAGARLRANMESIPIRLHFRQSERYM